MISILMPAHIDSVAKSDWLLEAVKSVQEQTFKDWELLIMDDLSSHFPELPNDERIRYFRTTEHKGPALARNTAAALAEFDALLPLDADDRLPAPDTLARMFDAWSQNKKRVVYGNIQRLEQVDGDWRITKVVDLPAYTFELSLNLSGIMPVSCLHSKAAHIAAGGWKREIEFGLEDVEYWIACGKAGYCGYHLGDVTLAWRRHETSRSYKLRNINQQERAMREKIRELHEDVYNGRYPMGCCGGGSRSAVSQQPGSQIVQASISRLEQVSPDQKVWVQYNGARSATFGIRGNFTGIMYRVDGPGHKLEVHINDLDRFRRHGRGSDFAVSVASPDNGAAKPAAKTPTIETAIFQAAQPELTRIERLDARAAIRG